MCITSKTFNKMFVYGPHGQGSDSEESEIEAELSPEELLLVNMLQNTLYSRKDECLTSNSYPHPTYEPKSLNSDAKVSFLFASQLLLLYCFAICK